IYRVAKGRLEFEATLPDAAAVAPEALAIDGDACVLVAADGTGLVEYLRSGAGWVRTRLPAGLQGSGDGITGRNLALRDDWLLVGGESARLYRRMGTTWSPIGFVLRRGASVALGEGVLALGDPDRGEVHVYDYDERGRHFRCTLRDAEAGEAFGAAVALDGPWLAVGAPGAQRAGAVCVFERRDDAWELAARIEDPAPAANSRRRSDDGLFGADVALAGSSLLVGEPSPMHDLRDVVQYAELLGLDLERARDVDGSLYAALGIQPDALHWLLERDGDAGATPSPKVAEYLSEALGDLRWLPPGRVHLGLHDENGWRIVDSVEPPKEVVAATFGAAVALADGGDLALVASIGARRTPLARFAATHAVRSAVESPHWRYLWGDEPLPVAEGDAGVATAEVRGARLARLRLL
ncbi:MAG TPA: hypothetical protein VJP77_04540, partial [Planctomycetota bacterium]|nr:hypothetical protein [Planctomycetota bacterium]